MNNLIKKNILKQLKKLVKITASSSVNFSCTFFWGQEKIPEEVKNLRKF